MGKGPKTPNPALVRNAASLAELRAMSSTEKRARTCKVCHVTYRSGGDMAKCQRWHDGR
jgi:hypothetical protein